MINLIGLLMNAGMFSTTVGVVLTMITSLVEYSHKLEYESIKHFVLREINNKLDSLSDKLLISMSKTEGKDRHFDRFGEGHN